MDAKMDACWGPKGRARGPRNVVLGHPVLFQKTWNKQYSQGNAACFAAGFLTESKSHLQHHEVHQIARGGSALVQSLKPGEVTLFTEVRVVNPNLSK